MENNLSCIDRVCRLVPGNASRQPAGQWQKSPQPSGLVVKRKICSHDAKMREHEAGNESQNEIGFERRSQLLSFDDPARDEHDHGNECEGRKPGLHEVYQAGGRVADKVAQLEIGKAVPHENFDSGEQKYQKSIKNDGVRFAPPALADAALSECRTKNVTDTSFDMIGFRFGFSVQDMPDVYGNLNAEYRECYEK